MGELVLDVGMHNGDDTSYYLARGYDVVAVEANPALCDEARERFADDIAAGHLSIRNIGIAESSGELEFWVSENSEWSSFHRDMATRAGAQAVSIRVKTMPFRDVLADLDAPLFIKIDIELNDSLCLGDLGCCDPLPPYVSFEGHVGAVPDIEHLAGLGYRGFKCVRQNDLREIKPSNLKWHGRMRRVLVRTDRHARSVADGLRRLYYRRRPVGGWRFPSGSSGPLGRDLPGPWLTRQEMLDVWEGLLAIDRKLDAQGLGEWFDVHAALEP